MTTLVRFRDIVNGPYQDEEFMDLMDVIKKKCKYQHYDFLKGLAKDVDYLRVVVISEDGNTFKEITINTFKYMLYHIAVVRMKSLPF